MGHYPEEQPNLEDVSKEAHKLFQEHQVDVLQEALHIDRALKLFEKYLKEGFLTENMSLREVMEKLAEHGEGLIGEEEDEE